jgi:hypothetical protein
MNAPSSGDDVLDGNALAGTLAEFFTVEITAAVARCAHCLRTGPLAEAVVYVGAPGTVARCPGCGWALLRVVRGPDRCWLNMTGVQCLQVPVTR